MLPPPAPTRSPTGGLSGLAAEVVLAAYRGLAIALSPALPVLIARRAARGKADETRNGERYGRPSAARPAGRVAWVHAASVGETIAVLPLIERLISTGRSVVFTSGTVTSAAIARARLPEGAIHQYAPLDVVPYVQRFLDHWRPEVAIVVESEIWPGTLAALSRRAIPIVVVNGRLSDRSFRRWQRVRSLVAPLFGRLSLVAAQSEEDGARFAALGAANVRVTGNLKWDAPPLAAHPGEFARLREAVGGRPVWLAASTHPGEEEIVAAAHGQMQAAAPGLLTIVVPRHPERGAAAAQILSGAGLSVARRSQGAVPGLDTSGYVADTLGELGLFYRLAPLAFIGNSLVPGGGHNPAEAVELGAAAFSGPHVQNFADVFARLSAAAPDTIVPDAAGLVRAMLPLLRDPALARRHAEAQAAALSGLKGALAATLDALRPYLDKAVAA